MELMQLEQLANAQHVQLSKTAIAIWRHSNRSSRVRNNKLESLGIVKGTPLEIDDPTPCDFERRFFKPSYHDEHLTHALNPDDPAYVAGLVETTRGKYIPGIWGETFSPRPPGDDDWITPTPDQPPDFRFRWFYHCVDSMQQFVLDRLGWFEEDEAQQQHESRTDGWRVAHAVETGDSTFDMPARDEIDWDYRSLWALEPRDASRPHFALFMGDSKIPRNADEMLVSELHAAAEMSKRQLACGDFTNHHTKPIIIYTFMYETHARITQAHFDAKTNKLVVRQSRLLDLSGPRPTADAYLLLRWMMNAPVGETEYELDDGGTRIQGDQRHVPAQPSLVMTGV